MTNDDYISETDDDATRPVSKRKPARRGKWLITFCVVAVVIFFLPNLVLMTPLRHKFIRQATSDVQGTVVVESVSGGWLQPIKLTKVQIADDNENLIFKAEEIHCSKNLLGLVFGNDYGIIKVSDAFADVHLRPGGSNFEDVFARYMETDPDQPSIRKPAIVNLVNASAKIRNESDGGTIELVGLNGQLDVFNGNGLKVDLAAETISENSIRGSVKLQGTFNPQVNELDFSNGLITGQFENGSACLIGAVLTRIGYPLSMTGTAQGNANIEWSGYGTHYSVGLDQVTLNQSIVASKPYINDDRVMIGSLFSHGKFQWSDGEIIADQLDLRTEFAKLVANGKIDSSEIASLLTTGQLQSSQFEVSGEIDVASVARMLRNTLKLHRDIRLTSGKLTFQSYCRPENQRQKILLNAEVQNLVGVRGNQQFSWHHPVRVIAIATQDQSATNIEELKIESDSFSLKGNGNRRQAELVTSGDLDRFARDLSQFFDLRDWRLSGKFGGRIRWTPLDSNDTVMDLQASFRLTNLDVSIPEWGKLQEKQLDLQCFARGNLNADQSIHIGQGTAIVSAGNDQLKFQLTQPVRHWSPTSRLVGQLGLSGDLNRWFSRAKVFMPQGTDLEMAGQVGLTAQAAISSQLISLGSGSYEIRNWKFKGYGLDVFESKVAGQCAGGVDFSKSLCQIKDLTLSASSVAARVSNMNLSYGNRFRLEGQTAFRGDVMKIINWFPAMRSDSIRYQGQIDGTGAIAAADGIYQGQLAATLKNVQIFKRQPSLNSTAAQNESVVWHEPTIVLQTQFGTRDFDRFDFQQLQLQSKALAIDAKGSIADPGQTLNTNLEGSWHPNWTMISKIVQGYTGQQVAVTGTYGQKFRMVGPVFETAKQVPAISASTGAAMNPNPEAATWLTSLSPKLKFETEIKWDRANVIGFPVGQGRLPIRYQARVLATENISFGVGQQGKVQVSPALDLRGKMPAVLIGKESSISKIDLDPELCHGWIKYIAPPIADATRVQGQFSATTESLRLPILSPLSGQGGGTLKIHRATVSSGPLANQLITLAKSIKQITSGGDIVNSLIGAGGLAANGNQQASNWIVMPEQEIPFKLHQNRVYHQGVTFVIDDVTIQTQGSVGSDQSIQMVASIQVLDKWIEGKPWLQGLKGKSIQIPISGTLKNPRVDQNALRQVSGTFLKQNVGQALNRELNNRLENEVQKGLQKLFGK